MSLRARLLVAMAVVAIVLVGAAAVITRATRAHLVDQVDDQLVDAAAAPVGGRLENRPGGPRPGREAFSNVYAALVDADGAVSTLLTPNLARDDAPLPVFTAEDAARAERTRRPFTIDSTDGDVRYRAIARGNDRLGGTLVLALPLDGVDATVRRLVAVEAFATILILAVLALVTFWVMRLGVRPIKQMTATATAIAHGDLSHRVPDVQTGTEAGELGSALNRMLGHIETAFDERIDSEARLRQFVADASHELRTPVTTIRGYAELYRGGGLADPDAMGEAMRRTEQEAVRMGNLVDDLLVLARLDQGRPLQRGPVDLTALAQDAVLDARAVDPERTISADTDGAVVVVGDDGRLRQVVANLVGNALVHTPPGTHVEVRVGRDDGRAVLEVRDEGQGMPPDVAARAFERFYRADPSRSRHRGGSGLGLAIVEATVHAHGGEVSITTAEGAGTTIRVELPATPPPVHSDL